MRIRSGRKHPRRQTRNEAAKHRQRVIERMKWQGDFIPPMPYHCINIATWWDNTVRNIQRHTDRKPCSCYRCGNPRRHWKQKPISELRLELMEMADYADVTMNGILTGDYDA